MAEQQNSMNKKMIGVVIVLVIMIGSVIYLMFSSSSSEDEKKNKSKTVKVGNSIQIEQKENTNPLFQKELEKYNQEQSQLAQAQNRSNIKILNPNKEDKQQGQIVQQPQKQKMIDYEKQRKEQQVKQEKEQKDHLDKINKLAMAKLKFFQMIQQNEARNDLPIISLDAGYSAEDFLYINNNQNNNSLKDSINLSSDKITEILVKGGEQFSATLDQALDTDINTEVFATIQSGKIKGANIMGRISMQGDYIRVIFNRMFYKDKTYNITAIGMDPQTNMAVLSGDIDNRFLERFGYPFLVSLIQGAGQAMAKTSSSTVVSAGGAVSTSSSEASDRAIIGEAVNQGMQSVAQGVNQNARKNRVIRRPADAIVVRFLAELSSDKIMDNTQNSNPNQNYFVNNNQPLNNVNNNPNMQNNFNTQNMNNNPFNNSNSLN